MEYIVLCLLIFLILIISIFFLWLFIWRRNNSTALKLPISPIKKETEIGKTQSTVGTNNENNSNQGQNKNTLEEDRPVVGLAQNPLTPTQTENDKQQPESKNSNKVSETNTMLGVQPAIEDPLAPPKIEEKKLSHFIKSNESEIFSAETENDFIEELVDPSANKRYARHAADAAVISDFDGRKIINGGALSAKYTDAFNNFRISVGNTDTEITNTFLPIQNVKRPVFIPFFDKYRLWPGRTIIIKGNLKQLDVDFVDLDSNEVLNNLCIKNDNFYINGSVKMSHLGNIISENDSSFATLAIECNLNYIQISCNEYKLGDLFDIDYASIGFLYIDASLLNMIDVEENM